MLHLRIAKESRNGGHADLCWIFMQLRFMTINDSYFFADTRDFENLARENKTTENFILLMRNYLLEFYKKVQQVEKSKSVFAPIDLYDEYQGGFLVEHLDERDYKVSFVYTLALYGYEIRELKEAIKVLSAKEKYNLDFQVNIIGGRVNKKSLLSSIDKAANNIELVDNFDFLFTWK
jgi:hypothetical protein